MAIQWNMLARAPNAATGFLQGVQQGQQQQYRNRLLGNQERGMDLQEKQYGLQERGLGLQENRLKMETQQFEQEQAREKLKRLGSLLFAAKQNPAAYDQIVQQAIADNLTTPDKVPPAFNEAWIDAQIATVTDIETQLAMREKDSVPAGYRKTETGYEFIPGGPADPAQAARLRAPEKPRDQFETVPNPFGRGGVGQRNKATGEIVNYQKPEDGPDTTKIANEFRDEFNALSKDFVKVRDAYSRVQTAASNPSPANDISLVFGYMKMIDPTSTVREGEFATAENSGGVSSSIINLYNKLATGERLTPAQREDFLSSARQQYETAAQSQEQLTNAYSTLATRRGVDPKDVIVDYMPKSRGPAVQQRENVTANPPAAQPPTIQGKKPVERMTLDDAISANPDDLSPEEIDALKKKLEDEIKRMTTKAK